MPITLPPSLPARRRTARAWSLLGTAGLLVGFLTALAGPASAAPATAPKAVPASPAPAASVPVGSLRMTGTTTSVTVHRIYRKGQVQWVSHVLDTRLVGLDRCQAERSPVTWKANTYRAVVRSVCVDGTARSEAAARQLVADRPWYHVRVTRVPLVGFTLLADLPRGSDRAVPASLAHLPKGDFTFADGDDLSLNYVGRGVAQAQLDAAVTAFANALGVAPDRIEVAPLAE